MGIRDFARELDVLINRATSVPTYQSRIVAQDIVTELLDADPELLHGWLEAHAVDLVHDAINRRDRSRRAIGVIEARSQNFQDALDEFVNKGTQEPIKSFLGTRFSVDLENNRKRLRDMNRHDLTFVADRYTDRAKSNGMLAALYQAMARRVGDRTVGEVFTEEQVRAMRETVLGSGD